MITGSPVAELAQDDVGIVEHDVDRRRAVRLTVGVAVLLLRLEHHDRRVPLRQLKGSVGFLFGDVVGMTPATRPPRPVVRRSARSTQRAFEPVDGEHT